MKIISDGNSVCTYKEQSLLFDLLKAFNQILTWAIGLPIQSVHSHEIITQHVAVEKLVKLRACFQSCAFIIDKPFTLRTLNSDSLIHSMLSAWYLYQMVTHFMLRTHDGNQDSSDKSFRFVPALELSKSLLQVE